MLTITLIALVLAIPLSSTTLSTSAYDESTTHQEGSALNAKVQKVNGSLSHTLDLRSITISATLFTRIVAIALLFSAVITYNSFGFTTLSSLDQGVGLYSGLIHATTVTQSMEVFLLVSGALILLPWSNTLTYSGVSKSGSSYAYPTIPEYPMLILFTTMGATFLLASADLVSMYLSIELQSFGVYILAAVYRDSESATAAGLKYFLLGALSSALILLGSGLIYSYTGLTNLNSIYELVSVLPLGAQGDTGFLAPTQVVVLGLVVITVGLLFKVAAAPFHYWAPDVYDGTPTIVTTWLTVMPKISIFLFLLELYVGTGVTISTNFMALGNWTLIPICAFLSLVVGTVVGLGQYRIKRLLAYSTISHVGFLLLALAIGIGSSTTTATNIAGEESVEAFLFYIIQYSLTNINTFFVLLAFGYLMSKTNSSLMSGQVANSTGPDIIMTQELQGQFRANPVLGLSFAICLFSMAGVPPLVGFFAKYTILYSAINNGYVFLALVAILASVVSAVYYLRIIRIIHFGLPSENSSQANLGQVSNQNTQELSSVHSYVIASLTLFILLFAVNPTLILNSTSIMALSLYCQ